MESISGLRARSIGHLCVIVAMGAVGLLAGVVPSTADADADADDKPSPAASATLRDFVPVGKAWKPSANANLRQTVVAGGRTVGELRPERSEGRKTIRMTSPRSSTTVDRRGSTVRLTATISTSEHRGKVAVRVLEVDGGKIVGHRSAYARPTSNRWRDVTVTYQTRQAGSRVRLYAHAEGVTRRHFLRLGVTETVVTPPGQPGPAGPCEDIDYSDPAQGRLTFADEFDGTSIDRDVWRVRDNTFLNQDGAWISKDNVSVHDGALDIVGRRMAQKDWRTNQHANWPENTVRTYSTGYIDSIDGAGVGNSAGNRFAQKYGHFEMRAKVPSTDTMSRGIWPAFWLRADHRPGEIDVMESYGAPTIRNFDPSTSYEWNSWADTSQQSTKDHVTGRAHPKQDNEPIWKDWHTYGVNWSPTCLRYTYDGKTVGLVPLSSKPYFTGPTFDDTFHLRLNLQIGSKYWGWPDPEHTRPEFHYLVDWVRVHQGHGR